MPSNADPENDRSTDSAGPEQGESLAPEIDLQALAKKVYALLRQEIRIERERSGWKRFS